MISALKRALVGAPVRFDAETAPRPIAEVLLAMTSAGLLPRAGRAEALSVAPVLRARNLICSTATLPLIQYDSGWNRENLPLLQQIDPDVANVVTLAQTTEDLLFEGISWWEIIAWDSADYPVYATHLDYSSVSLQPPGGRTPAYLPGGYDPRGAVIYFDGRPIPASRVIRFDSPNPGLLKAAGRAIRRAILLDTTSALYADNPRPLDYFAPTEGADPADDTTIQDLLDKWALWRKTRVTGYVPAGLEYKPVDVPTPADLQLVEVLKQAHLAIANATGLDPEDLGISTTSRTYQNATDRRQDRINDTFSPYMAAITQRLSMPDVTKRGRVVQHDLDDYLRADPLTRAQVYQLAKETGWLTPDEIRAEERRPELTISQRLELAPPAPAEPAQQPTPLNASADEHLHLSFDMPEAQFRVDAETRIIEGLAVPYGRNAIAIKDGKRWRFQQGSLRLEGEQSRNKLLRDHDFSQPQGPLKTFTDQPDGLFVRYQVGRGADGDRTLAEAQDLVRDGLSIGVDINDYGPDPLNPGVMLVAVGGAVWYETSILAIPAFTGARVTRVAATRDNGDTMETCATCGATLTAGVTHTCSTPAPPATPDAAPLQLSNEQLQGLLSVPGVLGALAGVPAQAAQQNQPQTAAFALTPEQIGAILATPNGRQALFGLGAPAQEERPTVDPTRRTAAIVREEAPYRFDRKGNLTAGKYDFSKDMIEGLKNRDQEALRRAETFVREQFAQFDTDMADAATLNPSVNRPDLYVDQKEFQYPIWSAIDKGTLADMTPFVLPKFNTSSGMVAAHVEGTEPSLGTFTATSQTITPAAVSGKVSITREAWDQGGNPQLSGLIWRQMTRAWYEALEAAAVTMLDAASPTVITVPTAAIDDTFTSYVESQLAALQFVRGGFRMRDFFGQVDFYKAAVGATDADGRKLLPVLGPTNAAGTTSEFYGDVSIAGLRLRPAWALAATGTVAASSYLFDRADVSGWATAPQRLTFENVEVRYIHVGIWGYQATAITDITGVREFVYDPA